MGQKTLLKIQWHLDNRKYVYDHFKGICQECKNQIFLNDFSIHHLTYLYNKPLCCTDALTLLNDNIITLVHKRCHKAIHTACCLEEYLDNKKRLKNLFYCSDCKKEIDPGAITRKKGFNTDGYICRKCFKSSKPIESQYKLF